LVDLCARNGYLRKAKQLEEMPFWSQLCNVEFLF